MTSAAADMLSKVAVAMTMEIAIAITAADVAAVTETGHMTAADKKTVATIAVALIITTTVATMTASRPIALKTVPL